MIGLSKLDMDASTMLLTNESIKPTPQIHSLRKVKLEVDDVVVLSDSNEDSIQVLDIAGTSSYPFQSPCSFTSTSSVQPLHGTDPSPHIHSQKPHVHPTSSISNVHILEALKITKCRRRSKSDLTNIDFDNIVIEDVKYLPSSSNGDFFSFCHLSRLEFQMLTARRWMAWTRFMMGMHGVEPKQPTFRMNLV